MRVVLIHLRNVSNKSLLVNFTLKFIFVRSDPKAYVFWLKNLKVRNNLV